MNSAEKKKQAETLNLAAGKTHEKQTDKSAQTRSSDCEHQSVDDRQKMMHHPRNRVPISSCWVLFVFPLPSGLVRFVGTTCSPRPVSMIRTSCHAFGGGPHVWNAVCCCFLMGCAVEDIRFRIGRVSGKKHVKYAKYTVSIDQDQRTIFDDTTFAEKTVRTINKITENGCKFRNLSQRRTGCL